MLFNQTRSVFLLLIPLLVMSQGCRKHFTPKPRGYFRIDLPEKQYRMYRSDCPFSFEFPVYASVVPDKDKDAEPCWLNIQFEQLHATIHLSYKQIRKNLPELTEDARSFVYKHTIKADAIGETQLTYPERKVYGILYDIEGNAASSVQFFLTDSTRHFIRGALYFSTTPNADSLGPVIRFIREDIIHLTSTFQWLN
ncbi:MAG: gliding motility lipoprotein GldD [Bacteroidales bacterium]|nr:gliding motility lipoprotein GldD [Bacteroidales bacterium]